MQFKSRLAAASKAASVHLVCSLGVAVLAGALVFLVWYPYPFRELSGGRELFFLIMAVDVVCGPLLTLVLFNPTKPKAELIRDLGLVALIQMAALLYGLWTVWLVRPVFLVNEFDRFKAVINVDVRKYDFEKLPPSLQPKIWSGPIIAGLRPPKDAEERQRVLFESLQGGADYAERPDFYLPYEGAVAIKSLEKARKLADFIQRYPAQAETINKIASSSGIPLDQLKYVPVTGRTDWIALVNTQGNIVGFVPGDGF
jgi:hypothetical protein